LYVAGVDFFTKRSEIIFTIIFEVATGLRHVTNKISLGWGVGS
jgi:hypothetical protein